MAQAKGTILVTGANGGLGSAIVAEICSKPEFAAHHGLYTVRDASRAPALQAALHTAPHPHSHDVLSLDLTQLAAVRETAAAVNARVAAGEIPPIRALILNAGYQEYTAQTWTAEGFDTAFASNYLGHWLLTLLLLQSMDREAGRIIVVGSLSHDPAAPQNSSGGQFSDKKWKVILHDSTEPVAKGTWSTAKEDPSWGCGFRRYGASKLCQLMMVPELDRRLKLDPALSSVSILGVDPGTMPGDIGRRASWLIRVFVFHVVLPMLATVGAWFSSNPSIRTTKKSAKDILAAAFDLAVRPPGLYLNGSGPGEMSPEARDRKKQEMLWKDTLGYAGLQEGETSLSNWK